MGDKAYHIVITIIIFGKIETSFLLYTRVNADKLYFNSFDLVLMFSKKFNPTFRITAPLMNSWFLQSPGCSIRQFMEDGT
ncbi:hypothetical protein Holit_02409 [Hollandina sp. SP2]